MQHSDVCYDDRMQNQTLSKILNTLGILFAILAIIAAAGIFLSIFLPVLILIIFTVICFQVANYIQRKTNSK
jgi:predicted PurR-regulated permease PerM